MTSAVEPTDSSPAVSGPRSLRMLQTYRYSRDPRSDVSIIDGFDNYHHLTISPAGTRAILEAGINPIARLSKGVGANRRPAILLRSSEWKVGQDSTPWHDLYELDHGHVRYFGDHKAGSRGELGDTRGNAALLDTWRSHHGTTPEERLSAAPLLIFRSVRIESVNKGHVQFCGTGVLERVELVVQQDPRTGRSFANYVYDIAVLDVAAENETLDWRWIDDRNDPDLDNRATLQHAPEAWRRWVREGNPSLTRLRRRVLTGSVLRPRDRRARHDTPASRALWQVYRFFDDRKYAFEQVAARLATEVLDSTQTRYRHGWITRRAGDGGTDFVGRLDLGGGTARTSLVVLGQAKCNDPAHGLISAEHVSRVVARLRRGWVGVYVSTGVFSEAAQREILNDEYPIVLIDGLLVGTLVHRLANQTHAGDVPAWLDDVISTYDESVQERRPEEILVFP